MQDALEACRSLHARFDAGDGFCSLRSVGVALLYPFGRISFSLAALFSVLLLLSCCKSEFSVLVHRGFWAAKLIGLAANLATIRRLVPRLAHLDPTVDASDAPPTIQAALPLRPLATTAAARPVKHTKATHRRTTPAPLPRLLALHSGSSGRC